jgi:5-methylcytosine-specific restriction protein A
MSAKPILTRPARPCSYPGCGALVFDGTSRCPAHVYKHAFVKGKAFAGVTAPRTRRWEDMPSGQGPTPYDSVQWKRARLAWLHANPLCAECQRKGMLRPATEVDHIRPHNGNRALFWDRNNWQSLDAACHSQKTIKEVNARIAQRKRDARDDAESAGAGDRG